MTQKNTARHRRLIKPAAINVLLIITSLFGYLEWGGGNSVFLFAAEVEIIARFFNDPGAMVHPFVLIPLLGQLLLLSALFPGTPKRAFTLIGICCIGLLLGFMFFIGAISANMKILLSTVPFLLASVLGIKYYRTSSTESI